MFICYSELHLNSVETIATALGKLHHQGCLSHLSDGYMFCVSFVPMTDSVTPFGLERCLAL